MFKTILLNTKLNTIPKLNNWTIAFKDGEVHVGKIIKSIFDNNCFLIKDKFNDELFWCGIDHLYTVNNLLAEEKDSLFEAEKPIGEYENTEDNQNMLLLLDNTYFKESITKKYILLYKDYKFIPQDY